MGNGRTYHREDDALEKAYDRMLMWRLMRYLRPHRRMAIFTLVLVLLSVCTTLASPWLIGLSSDIVRLKSMVEEDASSGQKMSEVFSRRVNLMLQRMDASARSEEERIEKRRRLLRYFGLAFLGTVVLRWLLQYGQAFLLQVLGQRMIYSMRMQVFRHLQSLSLSFYDKHPVGRLVTRVTNDINAISEMFSEALMTMIGDTILLVGIGAAMFWIHWRLALLTFAVVPLLFASAVVFRYFFRKAYRAVRGKLAGINAFLSESLLGMKTIQMFHQES